jgi:hypothetical protein
MLLGVVLAIIIAAVVWNLAAAWAVSRWPGLKKR